MYIHHLLLVFSFILFITNGYGQQRYIDSLEIEYSNAIDLENKTLLSIEISKNYLHVDRDKAEKYAKLGVQHANESKDQVLIADATEAQGSFQNANGNFRVAVDLFMQSLFIYERAKMYKEAAAVSNNIANAYLGIDDFNKAEEFYKISYDYGVFAKDTNAIAVPLVGLGILYNNVEEHEKALEAMEEAVVLFEGIGRKDAMVVCYVNSATYLNSLGRRPEAYVYMSKGREINRELNNKYFSGSILLNESQWLAEDGILSIALYKAEQAHEDFLAVGANHEMKGSLENLSNIHAKIGNYQKAFQYQQEYIVLVDSLNEVNRAEAMEEMSAKYDKAQDEKKIAQLSHQSELQKLENSQNKAISYFAIGGAAIMLILVILAFVAYRQKKRSAYELELKNNIIEQKNREIVDSLIYAKRIQDAIIPSRVTLNQQLPNTFVFYKPKDIVAGDFYWMDTVGDILLFAVADCTGHGVPGAMVSVVCNNALNRAVREFGLSEPAIILDKTRELVIEAFSKSQEDVKDGMDISLCAWNKSTNELKWAGANNPLWIIRKGEDGIEEFNGDRQPVGKYYTKDAFTEYSTTVKKDDRIYIFSDGFADQFGGDKGRKFKTVNLKKLLLKIRDLSPIDQKTEVSQTFDNWKGGLEQIDDVCIIGVKF